MKKIVDISWHKGYVDLQKIKDSGIEAIILKASDGFFMPVDFEASAWSGHTDPSFVEYWSKLKDYFPWRAAYHFLRVDDETAQQNGRITSIEQMDYFADLLEEQVFNWDDYAILDIEQAVSQINYLSKKVVAKRVENAIQKLESRLKRKPIIYTGKWWWEQFHSYFNIDLIYNYPFWISSYWPIENNDIKYSGYVYYEKFNRVFPPEWRGEDNLNKRIAYCSLPYINTKTTINSDKVYLWQYSDEAIVNGISSKVDVNYYIEEEENWNEARGEQPQDEEPETPPEDPPVEDPEEPPETPPEDPGETETPEGILRYLLLVLEGLVALIKKILGNNK